MTREIREKSREIGPEFVSLAWTPESNEPVGKERIEAWEALCKTTSVTYRAPIRGQTLRRAKLLGLSVTNTRRYLKPGVLRDKWVTDPHQVVRGALPKGKRVWLPSEFQVGTLYTSSLHKELWERSDSSELGRQATDNGEDDERIREGASIALGRGSLWDCTTDDQILIKVQPGCRVKLFSDGVGIGPPCCF